MKKKNKNKKMKLYVPRMSYSGARISAATFRSIGIDAHPSPASDARTLELGAKYLSGDECLPEKVTLGNFLKIVEDDSFDPETTAFLMPTAGGPCRFGQYQPLFRKIMRDKGYPEVKIFSPTSDNAYEGFGDHAEHLTHVFWNAIVACDILRKMQLRVRPYAFDKKQANEVFHSGLDDLCDAIAEPDISVRAKRKKMRSALISARDKYRRIPADYSISKPLIGVVGEIYCRLNEFSNDYLVNKIEEHGGEVWMTDVGEWVWYTNDEQRLRLIRRRKKYSLDMLKARIKFKVQKSDEHYLFAPFKDDFRGYEEPSSIKIVTDLAKPYLPQDGALGEMVLNAGKSIFLYQKGADGIIDVSPFSCMNGIVCEAVYPQISKAYNNFPIRIFYYDGIQTDLDRDIGIFMELVKTYNRRKKVQRRFPPEFD